MCLNAAKTAVYLKALYLLPVPEQNFVSFRPLQSKTETLKKVIDCVGAFIVIWDHSGC